MCIYYKEQNNLSYSSQEHIFPAAIGGITTLPKEMVSDQFNNDISAMEQAFIRTGLLSIPRQIVGPGKRGSLGSTRSTKSQVHVIKDTSNEGSFTLGFTSLAKAKEIPHMCIDLSTGFTNVGLPKEFSPDPISAFKDFKEKLESSKTLKHREIISTILPENLLLIGIAENIEENYNCFLAYHPSRKIDFNEDFRFKFSQLLEPTIEKIELKKYQALCHQTALMDIEHTRLFGKIAFNFIAYNMGSEFVKDIAFDNARIWISTGQIFDGIGANLQGPSIFKQSGLPFPQDGHYILLTQDGNKIYAEITLYGAFTAYVCLSTSFKGTLDLQGLVCNWKERKEQDLYQYLASIATP